MRVKTGLFHSAIKNTKTMVDNKRNNNPHQSQDDKDNDDDFYGECLRKRSIITGIDDVSCGKMKKKKKNSTCIQEQLIERQRETTWSMGSLMAALPLTPSPICSARSYPSSFPGDLSRVSVDFYTPTHQSSSHKNQDQIQSPKSTNISTLYESALNHEVHSNGKSLHSSSKNFNISSTSYDYEQSSTITDNDNGVQFPVLTSVPEDTRYQRRIKKFEEITRAPQVNMIEEEDHGSYSNRPKPYQQFLDEVKKHKRDAEIDAWRKAKSSNLLKKLKRKEAAINDWELKQRSKAEFTLDKIERKLEKKRTEATQKMHKKIANIKMEAENMKARERRSVLEEMSKFNDGNQVTPKSLCHPFF